MKHTHTLFLLLIAASVITLTACHTSQEESAKPETAKSETVIATMTETVTEAPAEISVNDEHSAHAYVTALYQKKLASVQENVQERPHIEEDSFSKVLLDVYKKAIQKARDKEECWPDYDIWLCSQDFQNPSLAEVTVQQADAQKAMVKVIVKLLDTSNDYNNEITIMLTKEEEGWKVSDLRNTMNQMEFSFLKIAQDYCQQ